MFDSELVEDALKQKLIKKLYVRNKEFYKIKLERLVEIIKETVEILDTIEPDDDEEIERLLENTSDEDK